MTIPPTPPHVELISSLHADGWSCARTESSALIRGLTVTTLTAPVGQLTIRVEALDVVAALTLSAGGGEGLAAGGYYTVGYLPWRATASILSPRLLAAIADASADSLPCRERGATADDLIRQLKPAGWKHTEEHGRDVLLRGQLESPDATRRIAWGPDEDAWHIARLHEHAAITADDATPLTVLRAMAEAE